MSLYEILDVMASSYGRIDFLWNFFIAIHLAIIGGLILISRYISLIERTIGIVGYLAFLYVNYNALIDAYAFQTVVMAEAKGVAIRAGAPGEQVVAYMRGFDLAQRIAFMDYAFIGAATITVMAILFANVVSRERRDRLL